MFNKFMKVSLLPVVATLSIGSFLTNLSTNICDETASQIKKDAVEDVRLEQPSENYDVSVIDSEKTFDSEIQSFSFSSPVAIDYVSGEGKVNLVDYEYNDGEVSCDLTNFDDGTDIILAFYTYIVNGR